MSIGIDVAFVLWTTYTVMTYVQAVCVSEVCFLSFVNIMTFHSSESILQITCVGRVPSFFFSFVNIMMFHSSESILQITCVGRVPSFVFFVLLRIKR